jgi:hypothetical protein
MPKKTGEFARIIFHQNKVESIKLTPRAIIPNDSKLFAQADLDKSISHFITSDQRSEKTLMLLKRSVSVSFSIINIQVPYNMTYGLLDL